MTTMRLASLPKAAQAYIANLERELTELRQAQDLARQGYPDSRVLWRPPGRLVEVHVADGCYKFLTNLALGVDVSIQDNHLACHVSNGTLLIRPQAANWANLSVSYP